MPTAKSLILALLLLLPSGIPSAIFAATLPCLPCAGVRLEPTNLEVAEHADPSAAAETAAVTPANPSSLPDATALLRTANLEPGSPLFVAWEAPLPGNPEETATAARQVAEAGGTPWLSLVFTTPSPLAQNAERLQNELRAAAAVAAGTPASAWLQVVWRPEGQESQAFQPVEYAFLIKRAAVALTGARQGEKDGVRVATEPLPADPAALRTFYGEEVAAYLEAVALRVAPDEDLAPAIAALQELDPGRPVVVDALPAPGEPAELLAEAARQATRGVGLTLFRSSAVNGAVLSPLALLAREFTGDLSYDAGSNPTGGEEAWAFVRGEDLALRVIAVAPAGASNLTLRFPDPFLRRPSRFTYTAGPASPPQGQAVAGGTEIRLDNPGRVAVLGIERASAAEREGVEEKVTIATEREMPVEEILRRLQAFEDAQERRVDHYQAVNTTHLRFQPAAGTQTFEATLQGPYFVGDKSGADWAWQALFVNGVRWRSKSIPEIPLVQPEKAAALPLADPLHQAVPLPPARHRRDRRPRRPGWSTSRPPDRGRTASSTRAPSGSTARSTPACAPARCRSAWRGRSSPTRRRCISPRSTPRASPRPGPRRATCCRCASSPSRSSRWSTRPPWSSARRC